MYFDRQNRDKRWYGWSTAAVRHPQALIAYLQGRLVLEERLSTTQASAVRSRYRS